MGQAKVITCGMYAFNEVLRDAWREFFAHFEKSRAGDFDLEFGLVDSVPRERLLFGHTCGYPYLKFHSRDYVPVCVPVFDAAGVSGSLYSSRMIVPANSGIDSLAACRGKTVALNGYDSNSGMNLLRYELARAGAGPGFFGKVMISGGHPASLEAVASGEAQLAAIDCVSFQLLADFEPALVAAVDSIGFTAQSCGLPFIVARDRDSPELRAGLLQDLERALQTCPPEVLANLHLQAFEGVGESDYQSILDLENFAVSMGYAELN